MLKMKGINAMTTINAHRFGLVKVNLPTVVYDIRVAKKKKKKRKDRHPETPFSKYSHYDYSHRIAQTTCSKS